MSRASYVADRVNPLELDLSADEDDVDERAARTLQMSAKRFVQRRVQAIMPSRRGASAESLDDPIDRKLQVWASERAPHPTQCRLSAALC